MSDHAVLQEKANEAIAALCNDTAISVLAEKYSLDDLSGYVHALLDAIEDQWKILLVQDRSGYRSLTDAMSALVETRLEARDICKRGEKHVAR